MKLAQSIAQPTHHSFQHKLEGLKDKLKIENIPDTIKPLNSGFINLDELGCLGVEISLVLITVSINSLIMSSNIF